MEEKMPVASVWQHARSERKTAIPILGYYETKSYYTLWKFIIDEKYQNKGYGKKALKLGIDYLVNRFKVKEIYTAYYSTNYIARNLYESFGFRETGEVAGSEVGMKLIVDDLVA